MTTKYFKENHPELSHLEGNDLLNAMEDSYLYEHRNDKPTEIADWNGNKIKEGDEICFITIKEINYFSNMCIMIPDGDGGHIEKSINTGDNTGKDCWVVGGYYKVFLQGTHPSISIKKGEYTFDTDLSLILLTTDKRCSILAIKGKSDNKKMYLKSFKQNNF